MPLILLVKTYHIFDNVDEAMLPDVLAVQRPLIVPHHHVISNGDDGMAAIGVGKGNIISSSYVIKREETCRQA